MKLKPRYSDAYNNLASAYMLQGQIQQAMETFQMALVLNPQLVDAHTNLGNLYKATGDIEAAKQCYLEAIRIKPEFPIAWNNLAGIFKEEGQLTTAVAYYREALKLCPQFADAHSNLGNALKELHQIQDAIACYQMAIQLRPDFAIAHGNLGSCYYDLHDYTNAIKCFHYAIQLEPNYPDAYNNLGNALKEEQRLDEAIHAYRSALHLKADHPHAYNNLGNAMMEKGYIKEAIHCYVTAIRLMPKFSAAHSNLGSVFKEQGKYEQAISHYLEAIKIDPQFTDAYCNLGNVYKETSQLADAVKCYETAIQIEPNYAEAYSNLAATYKDTGKLVQAIEWYTKALEIKPDLGEALSNLIHSQASLCDWSDRDTHHQQLVTLLHTQLQHSSRLLPSIQPFHSLLYPVSLQEMLALAKRYAAQVRRNIALSDVHFKYRAKPKSMKLRIGYLSSDFQNHPLLHLTQSLYSAFDKTKFEVFLYALSASDGSQYRVNLEEGVEHFVDVSGLHFSEVAKLIHQDNIHILVNLNGYTKGCKNEIFALRPAPIQVSFMGYCGTMGADYIQYIVGDNTVLPAQYRPYLSEKVIAMPHSYYLNDYAQSCAHCVMGGSGTANATGNATGKVTRSQYGLSEDAFVYCNFNQGYKIDPVVFACWIRILKRVKNAVLWLLRFPKDMEANLLREARRQGVRDNQLVFSDVVQREEHLLRCYLADLCLDTLVCNGHTTSCDVLWSGTPMISLPGEKMSARVGASLLRAVGLDSQLVVNSLSGLLFCCFVILLSISYLIVLCSVVAEYEELAVALAEDSDRLYAMRQHLESTRHSNALFQTNRWIRNFEQGLQKVWKRHEQSLPVDHVEVEDSEPVFTVQDKILL